LPLNSILRSDRHVLPAWPAQEDELRQFFERAVRATTMANAPIASHVERITIVEGGRIEFVAPDGARAVMTLEPHSASATFDRAHMQRDGAQAIVDAVAELGSSMAEQMETELIGLIKTAPETAGGTFSGTTPEEMGREFLRGLEAMDFGFDDDGNPTVFAVMHPETAARLVGFEDAELKAQADLIVARKRNEWLRRESYRRLAD
jgi:hypothetical protein